jgi:HAD superfamily hydrolase (TIGR01509 family)
MIRIELVLFDMDGLLLDTESIYTQVTQDIIGRFGYQFDWSLKQEMMGKKEEDAAQILIQTLGISMTVQEYLIERNQGHKKKFPNCKPLPGVMETVEEFHRLKVPMGVATSSHREPFLLKTMNNGSLFKYFNSVTCGDECRRSKPFPDIFQQAAKKINPDFDPAKVLVFEDAPAGVQAGLNAKMNVIWIPDRNLKVDQELADQCFMVLNSMEEFDFGKFCFNV